MPGRSGLRAYNSVYVIDHTGTILSSYDKLHLVPFGEYLPFQDFLERLGLVQLTKVQGGFLAGERRRKIAVPGAPPMLPLICYEVIFPGEAVPNGERPGWLLNLTNDAWFGISFGPYQHFQQARVRAIEEGLPLVRAANSGISAVIDPLGRIVRPPLGSEGCWIRPCRDLAESRFMRESATCVVYGGRTRVVGSRWSSLTKIARRPSTTMSCEAILSAIVQKLQIISISNTIFGFT